MDDFLEMIGTICRIVFYAVLCVCLCLLGVKMIMGVTHFLFGP